MADQTHPRGVPRSFANRSRELTWKGPSFRERFAHAMIDGACVGASDAQRRILLWNDKAKALFGWTKAEARGKKFDLLLKAKFEKPSDEVFRDLFRDGYWQGRVITQHKDGHVITLIADWKLVLDDQADPVILAWYTDISELHSAQQKIEGHSLELQKLNVRLTHAIDEERARMAREFHDHVGQAITVAKVNLYQATASQPGVGGQKLQKQLKQAISALDAASKLTQNLCMELRPTVLDDASLAAAIRWQTQQIKGWTKGHLKLEVDPNLRIDPDASMALFRILQESLTNIVRHAKAKQVNVSLLRADNCAQLTIRDNGRGMDTQKIGIGSSLGLLGMRERAAAVGGNVEILSELGKGTTVTARVPL
jgi:PAS domain S-box-containing protein